MLNKRAFYGDDWGTPSAEHPAGECLNRSAPGVEDGSYFEKSWVNDLMALPGALMNAAGYTPNGIEDTATASQVFDALVNGRWSSIANYTIGTIVTASDGKQYYCNKDSGRDTTSVDPVSDILDNWREYPYEKKTNSNGVAYKYWDGRLVCKFSDTSDRSYTADQGQFYAILFPESFINTDELVVTASLKKGLIYGGRCSFTAEAYQADRFSFRYSATQDSVVQISYIADGRWI